MDDKQVSKERTGWRDVELAERHRMYGWNCPAVDIDHLVVEYDAGTPVALVEMKHKMGKLALETNPNMIAIRRLADASAIPFFQVRYSDGYKYYEVHPMNRYAKALVPERAVMDEYSWVIMLYDLRKRNPPQDVLDAVYYDDRTQYRIHLAGSDENGWVGNPYQ